MKTIYEMTVQELVEKGFYVSVCSNGTTERSDAMELVQAMLPSSSVVAGATGFSSHQFSGARASSEKVSVVIW